MKKKAIVLKLTGELLMHKDQHIDGSRIAAIAEHIKALHNTHHFSIVIGGGNFFLGSRQGVSLGLTPFIAHQIGMLATIMNGLIVNDIFEQHHLPSRLFSAFAIPEIAQPLSQQLIESALSANKCLIFSGGTGNPFFSTDTTAILRALQVNAVEVWKGTLVDGIYSSDPHKDTSAEFIPSISHQDILQKRLGIMDLAAIALAQQYRLPIRIFNIFHEKALLNAAQDQTFGSIIH
jgi:uridylate kinase